MSVQVESTARVEIKVTPENWGPWLVSAESLFDRDLDRHGVSIVLTARGGTDPDARASMWQLVTELRNALDAAAAEL